MGVLTIPFPDDTITNNYLRVYFVAVCTHLCKLDRIISDCQQMKPCFHLRSEGPGLLCHNCLSPLTR